MTSALAPSSLLVLLRSWPASSPPEGPSGEAGILTSLSQASFQEAVWEAMAAHARETAAEARPPGGVDSAPLPASETAPTPEASAPLDSAAAGLSHELEVIGREARRAEIDPTLLVALRRVENGGVGREFGVLSVPAPTLDDQARVAANTIRNTMARFEREGGRAADPLTGRYTQDFVRFFSARYAPLGADNDPAGLNRHHAENLLALYRKASGGESGG